MKGGKKVPGKDYTKDELKEIILERLEKNLGFVVKTCEQLNISRKTLSNYINEDPIFKEKVSEIYKVQCEYVEDKLFDKIRQGDTTAILFYLRHKGGPRGYKEEGNLLNSSGNIGTVTVIKLNGPTIEDIQAEDITNKPYIPIMAPKNNDNNGE
jgi:hypothetical protein